MKNKAFSMIALLLLLVCGVGGLMFLLMNPPMGNSFVQSFAVRLNFVCFLLLSLLCAFAITIGLIGLYVTIKGHFKDRK